MNGNELPAQVQKLMSERDTLRGQLAADTAPPTSETPQDTAPDATPLPQASEEPWEARFQALQGKYTAEVPRLHAENRQLRDELAVLKRQVETLAAAPPVSAVTAPPSANPDRETLAAYDEGFGHLVDLVELQKTEIAELKQSMAALKGNVENVGQTQIRTAQELFWDALSAEVPDYAVLNEDPDFVAWLNETDGLSDMTRKEIGDRAFATLDSRKAIRVFKEFKASRPVKTPPPPKPQNITPPSVAVVPDTNPQQGVVYRKADMDAVYEKLTRREFPIPWQGGWIKDDMEAKIVRAELQRAAFEGRILP